MLICLDALRRGEGPIQCSPTALEGTRIITIRQSEISVRGCWVVLTLPSQSYMYYEADVLKGLLSTGIPGTYLCDYPRILPKGVRNWLYFVLQKGVCVAADRKTGKLHLDLRVTWGDRGYPGCS